MKYDEDLNVPMIAMGAAIFVIAILAVIIAGQGLFYSLKDSEDQIKKINPIPEAFTKYTIEQEGMLSSFRWIDKNNGVVAIPIETAMDITTKKLEAERIGVQK